jgi:hypothetical protein
MPEGGRALAADQAELMRYVDGSRNIREIAKQAGQNEDEARRFFEALWRADFLAAALPTKSRSTRER